MSTESTNVFFVVHQEAINSLRTSDKDLIALQDDKDLHVKLITIYGQINVDDKNLLNIYRSLSAKKQTR